MSERVRREVRELVDGFGPPRPGLAARAVAGLPDRPARRAVPRWTVATAAALVVLTGLLLWAARSLPRAAPAEPAGVAALEGRPLASVPTSGPTCQVDARRANVVAANAMVTLVSGSGVPLAGLVTVQTVYKPEVASTVGVTAGPDVSGPVLVRGHRLDGPGTLALALAPATPARRELTLGAGPAARRWDLRLQASAPGCYAIQFDGARFSEQAVLPLWPHSPTSLQQTMDPAQARVAVRAAVTGARPILLPDAIGADWRTDVGATADGFTVRYTDPSGSGRTVTVATAVANPPQSATRSGPGFHGDSRSLYVVNGATRILLWHQPGVYDHADPSYPGVPYELTATGLSDAEFWQIANSLA